MARIPLLTDQQIEPPARGVLDDLRSRGAAAPDIYRLLANAPDLLKAWTDLAWPLRACDATPRGLRELLILRTAQQTGAAYEWAHHWPLATAAGVPEETLGALPRWRESACFSQPERAALAMAVALAVGTVLPEGAYADLAAHFGPQEQVQLVLTVAFYICVARFAGAFELETEAGFEHVPNLPAADGRAGQAEADGTD